MLARARYALESHGPVARAALRSVAADHVLLGALRRGQADLARAEADRIVFTHRLPGHVFINHVVRIRFAHDARVLIDTNATNFAVAGSTVRLRRRDGLDLGVLTVTVQDVSGYLKTVHDLYGFDLVAGTGPGRGLSTLHRPVTLPLASSGCVTLASTVYAVRSFAQLTFTGRRLTVWILIRG